MLAWSLWPHCEYDCEVVVPGQWIPALRVAHGSKQPGEDRPVIVYAVSDFQMAMLFLPWLGSDGTPLQL